MSTLALLCATPVAHAMNSYKEVNMCACTHVMSYFSVSDCEEFRVSMITLLLHVYCGLVCEFPGPSVSTGVKGHMAAQFSRDQAGILAATVKLHIIEQLMARSSSLSDSILLLSLISCQKTY